MRWLMLLSLLSTVAHAGTFTRVLKNRCDDALLLLWKGKIEFNGVDSVQPWTEEEHASVAAALEWAHSQELTHGAALRTALATNSPHAVPLLLATELRHKTHPSYSLLAPASLQRIHFPRPDTMSVEMIRVLARIGASLPYRKVLERDLTALELTAKNGNLRDWDLGRPEVRNDLAKTDIVLPAQHVIDYIRDPEAQDAAAILVQRLSNKDMLQVLEYALIAGSIKVVREIAKREPAMVGSDRAFQIAGGEAPARMVKFIINESSGTTLARLEFARQAAIQEGRAGILRLLYKHPLLRQTGSYGLREALRVSYEMAKEKRIAQAKDAMHASWENSLLGSLYLSSAINNYLEIPALKLKHRFTKKDLEIFETVHNGPEEKVAEEIIPEEIPAKIPEKISEGMTK